MSLTKRYLSKLGRMLLGFTLISLAVVLTKQSLCLAPWNVLNDGCSHAFNITIGQASIWVGVAILLVDILSRERLGFGMVLNIWVVGWLTDLLFWLNGLFGVIPRVESIPLQIVFCLAALTVNGLGIYFYMSACMGAGPRDTLIVFLTKKLPIPVGACKLGLEAAACLAGWLLGGEVGIGTFVSVFCGGPILQWIFRLFHFDVKSIHNESFRETWNLLSGKASDPVS